MWYRFLHWTLFIVATSSTVVAQSHLNAIRNFVDTARAIANPQYYIIEKDANTPNFSGHKGFYLRQLSPHFYVTDKPDINNARIIGPANNRWKVSSDVHIDKLIFPAEFMISIRGSKDFKTEFGDLKSTIIAQSGSSVHLLIQNEKDFQRVIGDDDVVFIKSVRTAHEESPNSFQDISVNKINLAHLLYPNINGQGISVSLKEKAPDVTDIDLKNRIVLTELADEDISLHANLIGTIIAGGGNSMPNSKGAAWKSSIISTSYDNLLPDDESILQSNNVSVQNHSYGTAVENFYGPEALAYDEQVIDNPTLLHVFSSGNSGELTSETGPYEGIEQFANMTGNMKMAKNVLVVGGHYQDYEIDSRNSRGPAYDGRIKPEVVAFGPEGTSDAAAFVSGICALLQHQYKNRYGKLPKIDLIKSSMIATTDDVDVTGIDFISGFGAVNAYKSAKVIAEKLFFEDSVTEDETRSLALVVPTGVQKLRVALNWIDEPATTGDGLSLVNDLDMTLTNTSNGERWLPWVLNSFAHRDSLMLPAKRKEDHINNIEFISIDNPDNGSYEIEIKANNLAGDRQSFAVAYWLDMEENFTWTYPTAADPVQAGTEIFFRWDQSFDDDLAIIEIRFDGYENETISYPVSLEDGFSKILMPDVSAVARAIMKINGSNIDTTEFILSRETILNVEFNCNESAMISWPKISQASAFTIFNLGDFYMDSIASTTDTTFVVDKALFTSPYFAIEPIIDGRPGVRSAAYDVNAQGVNCYYINFLAEQSAGVSELILNTSTTFNIDNIEWQKFISNSFVTIGETPAENKLRYTFLDADLKSGVSQYRAIINTKDGRSIATDTATIYFADEATFALFPNPVLKDAEVLNILTNANAVSVVFYDSMGRRVKEQNVLTSLFKIYIDDLISGIYYVSFQRDGKPVSSSRLIIK
jgi:hypothetical protein